MKLEVFDGMGPEPGKHFRSSYPGVIYAATPASERSGHRWNEWRVDLEYKRPTGMTKTKGWRSIRT